MKTIKTSTGDYHFEPVDLYHGRKKLNKIVSRDNLLTVRDILMRSEVRWGLIYGTLLGAMREGDFIEHDEDTDIYIFHEDRKKLIDNIPEFVNHGFKVARYDASLMSIIRGDDYIDFYFFKRRIFGERKSGGYFVPNSFFTTQSVLTFLGVDFPTVNEPKRFLAYVYGEDWRIPQKDKHATSKPVLWKATLRKALPTLYRFYRSRKQ